MYFSVKEHELNYKWLMQHYRLVPGQDVQYEANIYVAAHPMIFECFKKDRLDTTYGPLQSLVNDDLREEGAHNIAPLTGSTERLIEVGISLYNGREIDLNACMGSFGSNTAMFQVFMQAVKIRARQ